VPNLDPDIQAALDFLEQRLNVEIDRRALSNPDVGVNETQRAGGRPPAVQGLTLGQSSSVGSIQIRWSPVPIADLRRYEVEVATDPDFTGLVEGSPFTTTRTGFEFTEGGPGETFFFRVRAVNQQGVEGGFSGVLDSATGRAGSADLFSGAATEWARVVETSFDPPTIGNEEQVDLAEVSIVAKGGLLLYFVLAEFVYLFDIDDSVFVEVLEDDVVVDGFESFLSEVIGGRQALGLSGFLPPRPPGERTYKIRLRIGVSVTGGDTSSVEPFRASLAVVEVGREGLL